ncbi:uncharacterized protein LOC110871782 [Helianthus annuus]|uniref:uncharacterized protein LOC110871782 n=1 Tax=Helianthus annuus TaxID=4232 RepID=UPI0016531E8D|nr:uncharacterized protein LOC110871782 [Helianthus annuus]
MVVVGGRSGQIYGLFMWPDLIQNAKEGVLDVIQTYVFWNGHEPQPGFSTFEGVVSVENGHIGENESGPHVSESVCVEKAPGPSFPKDAVDGMLGHLELLIPTAALLPCLRLLKDLRSCGKVGNREGRLSFAIWMQKNMDWSLSLLP